MKSNFHSKKGKKGNINHATEEANTKLPYCRTLTEDKAGSWVLLKKYFKQKDLNSRD